ncbi:YceD family protein [Paenibacillus sp. NPDC058071]|uniref:YceD family protein n=1 Tax=Paenibacillus sp. NPDC058071 TaxID=3346326 RepID=UPI0036D8CAEB
MQFHVKETMSKGLKANIDEKLDVSALFKGRTDVISTGPLHVLLKVTGNEGSISVEGELSIDWELACSRCLDPVQEHTVIPFFEQFKPASNQDVQEEGEEEEDDVIAVKEDRLDLKPYVEEALLLFMPFAPLCSDDCKGLCHNCGQNLNEHTCGCKTEKIDPRLAVLKDLFKEQ